MNWFFKNIVAPRHYRKLDNGKWFKIEILFLYMALASCILASRYAYTEQTSGFFSVIIDIICYAPFAIGFLALARTIFYRSLHNLSDIRSIYPLTRLDLYTTWWFRKSESDKVIGEKLSKDFEREHGYLFRNKPMSWLTWFVIVLWIVLCGCLYVFFHPEPLF